MKRFIKRKIIIDCDPGIDDALAILLALHSQELDVLAITVVCGNVPTAQGVRNVTRILKQCNRLDIPVYMGEEVPLKRKLVTAQDTHGEDGLGETDFPEIEDYPILPNAVNFLLDNADSDIHLITLGPYTNIAKAYELNAEQMNHYGSIISMGGNFRAQGNCSDVAEFNFWVDPDAADFVFKKVKTPITLLGLDVTRQIVLTPKHREWLKTLSHPLADFIYKITQFYVDFHLKQEGLHGCVINDPLVIAYILFPEMGTGFFGQLSMVCEGEKIGQSVIIPKEEGANVHYLLRVDPHFFFNLFFERLLGMTPPDGQR